MNRAKEWTTRILVAAAGVLLISCKGDTANPAAAPVDAAPAPKLEAVVYRAPFHSEDGQKWIKSTNIKADFHVAGSDLAWSNADGMVFDVVEAACLDEQGHPKHCHLEVRDSGNGQFDPKRSIEVTKIKGSKAYRFVLRTEGENAQTEFMTCANLEEAADDDQYISGKCDIYPVLFDYPDPKHDFCAHTRREADGTLGFYYRFTHGDCSLSTGTIHNGTGHARGR